VVKNFAGLVACRVFIGFPEVVFCSKTLDDLSEIMQAAFYPGTIYLLSRLVVYDSCINSDIDFLQAGTQKRLIFNKFH
jgi:hypothetical protein